VLSGIGRGDVQGMCRLRQALPQRRRAIAGQRRTLDYIRRGPPGAAGPDPLAALGKHLIADFPDHIIQAAQSLGDAVRGGAAGQVGSGRHHQAHDEHVVNHRVQQLPGAGHLICGPGS